MSGGAGAGLAETLAGRMPELRGRMLADEPLAGVTWFRVGGPADVLYSPADESDLAYFISKLPAELPVTVIGLGSNLLVRDGGVRGVVVRLARGFSETVVVEGHRITCGTAVPDVKLARAAADASLGGLAFYRGIPGSIGGALRMNAGAHGRETKDVLIGARAIDRSGQVHVLSLEDMQFSYRHSGIPRDWIFTAATYQGQPGDRAHILAEMEEVAQYRELNQPIRERTGGSTFKNPPGHSAWKLIDAAGCRGFRVGGAKVSEMHCNFLINDQDATGEDIERLGETVRVRVQAKTGILLQWEIVRLGEPLPGHAQGEALALGAQP